jgi:multiple sugar transport system permease protein
MLYFMLVAMAVFFGFPFFWLITNSLKDDVQIFTLPPTVFPNPAFWTNYPDALEYLPLLLYTWNSVLVVVGAVILTLLFPPVVAYGFSKISWKYREKVFLLVISTMMIPFAVTMIPVFVMFSKAGLTRSLAPLILPRFFNVFYIFLLRQFLFGVPDELVQAAKIDGCSHFRTYISVILPLIKPALLTVTLFEINERWHDFIGPLVFLRDEKLYTLAVGLRSYAQLYATEWDLQLAACTMFTLPIIIVFFFFQKRFIEGISTSGIKF